MLAPKHIDRILRQHRRGANHKHRIWTLLLLELWHRLFVDGTMGLDDVIPLR